MSNEADRLIKAMAPVQPIDFESDVPTAQIPQQKLNSLGEMAMESAKLDDEIEQLTAKLKVATERQRYLLEAAMPEIMLEIGLSEVKTTNGRKLTMTKFYAASIPEETSAEAFAWLRERDYDSIIKNEIKASFGKGEDEKVQALMEKLVDDGFVCKTTVHPMTLKSFVKERIEAGEELPPAIKVHIGNKVKIK